MTLPSQEIHEGIKELISEITGFQENDENFAICERYCLSHVVHHTYPFTNRTTVKDLISSYVSRFYSHGYFQVSQELDDQVKSFLNNEKLFEKNPQYDIQWCLLSLLSSLSSNLTSVKKLPVILPTNNEENETEDFDWKEYLIKDLMQPTISQVSSDSDKEESSRNDDDENYEEIDADEDQKTNGSCENFSIPSETESTNRKLCQEGKKLEVIFNNKNVLHSSEETRRQRIEEFLRSRRSTRGLEDDFRLRGNISEKFDSLLNEEGIVRKSQLISEFEMMENILFQFQTGETIFLRKGLLTPALTSLTQDTLGNYLESLQPYFNIIKWFKDFDVEVTEAKYPEVCLKKGANVNKCQSESTLASVPGNRKQLPNVLYMYNVMLKMALEPFQNEITNIVENLGNYTLIKIEQKLKFYYGDLTSLFHVHKMATNNWKNDSNWMSSIRILSVLFNAIMDATSSRMSFLYMNFFLGCFQIYLDLIDNWISVLDLIDPNDEFIVTRSNPEGKSENRCSEYIIRPYKTEMENFGMKNVMVLDFISEKMIHVGQSLEVLRRLNRFVSEKSRKSKESSYRLLLQTVREKVDSLGKVKPTFKKPSPPIKQKSIFTMKNSSLGLERDGRGGDSSQIGNLLAKVLQEENNGEVCQTDKSERADKSSNCGGELIGSMVKNPFFKMAFDGLGMKQVQKQLEKAKARQEQNTEFEFLKFIQKPEEEKNGIYPLHKIVTESFHVILENRVSGACALVKDIVLRECDLVTHLSLLRSILLFNNSYLIQPFFLALFTQPVIWESSYSLSLHLRECVRGFYKDYANALSVTLSKNGPNIFENILHVIDGITVNYEVKWPLTLIITPEALRKYNEVFRLALKLKWAHWALCGLSFQGDDATKKSSKPTRHRLQVLTFWLLNALGRINNYFLAQMTPEDLDLSSCNDLKDIAQGHSDFLEKVHHNCLLGEKSPKGWKLIFETFIPLCMDLLLQHSDLKEEKLDSIEKTYRNCYPLLSHLLSSLEK